MSNILKNSPFDLWDYSIALPPAPLYFPRPCFIESPFLTLLVLQTSVTTFRADQPSIMATCFEVANDPGLGRYLKASRDIKPLELVSKRKSD